MKYISSTAIIDEVKNELSFWFENHSVDETLLYPCIRFCMSKIKLDHYPEKTGILQVENYKATLPKDFKQLCIALACTSGFERAYTHDVEITEERTVCELNVCETICDVCTDSCGSMYKIIQKFPTHWKEWNSFDLLKPTSKSYPYCYKNCFNFRSKSKNEIEINGNVMHTNFEQGLIYIEYIQDLETEDDYQIPDNETVIAWVKAEMIFKIFQTLFYNEVPNIVGQYKAAEKELFVKSENARQLIKRSEFTTYYDLANILLKRYNNYGNAIWHSNDLTR
jgi:hypothetical protein